MSLRVVVLAEGSKETGALAVRPAPGVALGSEELGAAHVLIRRCLVASSRMPEAAIHFQEPLRLASGSVARGASLRNREALRKLLAYPPRGNRPDLAILLVDADGDPDRRRELEAWTWDAIVVPVVAVPIQEFEAWLVADHVAVARAVHLEFPTPMAPEAMEPGVAKRLLEARIGEAGADPQQVRRTIADSADLERIADRAPSFQRFRADLAASLSRRQ
jgi:hypothetical protein